MNSPASAARTRQYTVTLTIPLDPGSEPYQPGEFTITDDGGDGNLTEIYVRQRADDGMYWLRRLRRKNQL